MGLSYGLFVCLLLWGGSELCYPQPLWFLQGGTRQPAPPVTPVVVECLEARLVVTVSRDLFGTGKLIQEADLSLGPEGCEPQASTDAAVRFEVGLHECGNSVQVTDDSLVYSSFLLHDPRPVGNLSILRTNRAEVPIECRYPRWTRPPGCRCPGVTCCRLGRFDQLRVPCHRQGNVSSRAILPTWVPFWTTVLSEERLVFSLRLMEANWSREKMSPTFHLGDTAHLQAEVRTGSHPPLLLFVDRCVATPTRDQSGSPYHTIVDLHGCLVDGLSDGASKFKAPRPKPDVLQFMVAVFHFANDSRHTVYITCHLRVIPAQQAPDQLNKACSFNQSSSRWVPVEGSADICECCGNGDCDLIPGSPMNQNHAARSSVRSRRHVTEEADVTVGPLIFLGKAGDPAGTEGLASAAQATLVLGFGLATVVFLAVAAVVLGLARGCHTASHPRSASQ